jgi:hypothetical protein
MASGKCPTRKNGSGRLDGDGSQLPGDPLSYIEALNKSVINTITDTQGTIIYADAKFEQISGYAAPALIHRILNSGTHPTAFFKNMYRTIGRGSAW